MGSINTCLLQMAGWLFFGHLNYPTRNLCGLLVSGRVKPYLTFRYEAACVFVGLDLYSQQHELWYAIQFFSHRARLNFKEYCYLYIDYPCLWDSLIINIKGISFAMIYLQVFGAQP